MTRRIEADYLVAGAGATGMAFTDALTDHADVRVALVDRRHSVSGHWLEAYPFVQLHQASAFYGVASTLLGGGRLQQSGPEEGLQERASPYGNSMAQWARMTVLGARAAASFSAEPDITEWSDRVALNPARTPPGHPGSAALDDARERLATHALAGWPGLRS